MKMEINQNSYCINYIWNKQCKFTQILAIMWREWSKFIDLSMIDWDTDYKKKIFSIIKSSTKSLSNSKNLKDLDTFWANQRNECVPISSANNEFEVTLKDIEADQQKIKIKIGDTESKVTFKKLGNSDLFKIRFHWENPQVLWTHDLKVCISIKKEGGSYELLNKEPIYINKLNKSKVLCKLDISKYQGDYEPKEEIKEKSKSNKINFIICWNYIQFH